MEPEADPSTEIRRRPLTGVPDVTGPTFGVGAALLQDEGNPRFRYLVRGLVALVVASLLGLLAYEAFFAPKDDPDAWVPPPGMSVKDTPPWLQALCAKRTPELCTLANRAQNPSDCAELRATLRSLEALERKLKARGAISPRQHFVLTELYGQGHQLCQFTRGETAPAAK